MYEKDGEKYFVVDSHSHFWDASRENWREGREEFAKGWIDCFYGYHQLGPPETHWDYEKYLKVTPEDFKRDMFEEGHVDVAIFQSTYLKEWYTEGFNTIDQNAALLEEQPVVVRRDEADLLAVLLREGPQASGPRELSDRRLLEVSERRRRALEVGLGHGEQLIGLVLGSVDTASQANAAVLHGDPRVVSRRDAGAAELVGEVHQLPHLQVAVADRAGVRRSAAPVLGDVVFDDVSGTRVG